MSVVVPFYGDAPTARKVLAAVTRISLGPGDEILIADNTLDGVLVGLAGPELPGAFAARVPRSPYAARNEGAGRAVNEWVLFTDADCLPAADLLDAYFRPHPAPKAGAVAGEVLAAGAQTSLIARYGRARSLLSQEQALAHPYRPMAVTANLLVRRAAWQEIGGFAEGIRSGGDGDLCWRLQEAGWTLEYRAEATVEHLHRETLPALLRQSMRTAASVPWAEQRHPGLDVRAPLVRSVARGVGGAVVFAARGQRERAAFKLVDVAVVASQHVGYRRSNTTPAPRGGS